MRARFLTREALNAHDRGWLLIPLDGKKPRLKGWPKMPPPSREDVERWAAEGNLGVRTGLVSGVVVIDVDSQKGGSAEGLDLPKTVTARSGGGGLHFYFRCPEDGLKNSTGKLAKNVDVRGDGGQIVLPGSVHPKTGENYSWEKGLSPDEVEFAELPAGVLKRLAGKKRAGRSSSRAGPSGQGCQRALENAARIVAEAPEGKRNVLLNKQAFRMGQLVGAQRLDRGAVERELTRVALEAGLPEDETQGTLESGLSAGVRKPASRNPSIELGPGRLPEIVTEAEDALLADQHGEQIYQRGNQLVRVIRGSGKPAGSAVERASGALLIRPATHAYLVERLMRSADFVELGRTEDGRETEIVVDCPEIVARTYLAREGLWRVPHLAGIVEAPTLGPDGALIQEPGYDAGTGLYFDPGTTKFRPVPKRPTLDDARKGLALLKRVLEKFPWVDASDESTALAAILTALIRRSLPSAPLFAFRAPTMGSGKSLLADVVAMHSTGRPAPVMSQGKDEDEIRKRIFAVLLEGDPVACIDNVERPLGGPTLCSVLTQRTYKDRVLGFSKTANVPTTTTFAATGNNMTIEGDLKSRVLPCDLDPVCEHPEKRPFDVDLYEYVPRHRGELVAGALTIPKAYLEAGSPDQGLDVFGRFERWSAMVRSPLVWCGLADPCEGRERLDQFDPVTANLRAVLRGWHELAGDTPHTARDLISMAKPNDGDAPCQLWEVLVEIVSGRDGSPDPQLLGKWLARYKGRIECGLRVVRSGDRHHTAFWKVIRA